MPKKVLPEEEAHVLALLESGASRAAIERETGLTAPTVRRIIREADAQGIRSYRPNPGAHEAREEIVRLGRLGQMSRAAIAAYVGVSRRYAADILDEENIPAAPRGSADENVPLGDIAARLKEDESLRDLANEFNLDYKWLHRRLVALGFIQPRPYKTGIPAMEFIQAWQESPSATEAAERLGITAPQAYSRAIYYRKRGVPLRRHLPPPYLDYEALAEYAAAFLEED